MNKKNMQLEPLVGRLIFLTRVSLLAILLGMIAILHQMIKKTGELENREISFTKHHIFR